MRRRITMSPLRPDVEQGTLQDFLTSEIKELPSPTQISATRFKTIGLRGGLMTKQELRTRDAGDLSARFKNNRAVSQMTRNKPRGTATIETASASNIWA